MRHVLGVVEVREQAELLGHLVLGFIAMKEISITGPGRMPRPALTSSL